MTTVQEVLERARIAYTGSQLLAESATGSVYRVDTSSASYAVRLPGPGEDPAQPLLTSAFLQHLARNTVAQVPRVVQVVPIADARYATVLGWVEGERLGKAMTTTDAYGMGALLARIHTASDSFVVPASAQHLRWDWDRWFGSGTLLHSAAHRDLLSDAQRAILVETGARVAAAIDRIRDLPQSYGMLHADLHTANGISHQGTLSAIDFSDGAPGWYLFDIAVPLLDFAMDWDTPRDDLRDAWLAGYQAVRPLTPQHWAELPVFLAVRCAEIANWVLEWSDEDLAEDGSAYVSGAIDWLAAWLG